MLSSWKALGHIVERRNETETNLKLYLALKEIVFVGVPHPTRKYDQLWKLNNHLIAYGKFGAARLKICVIDCKPIATLSDNFTSDNKQHDIVEKIFSIYEKKETKYWYNFKARKTLVRKTTTIVAEG